ncbi:MAG: hypothetical protein Q8L26_06975 [Candidatus Omnitrophota bacterium]|nr:hypothetical protein [Candidatus Omnitrophota bacterium]
MAKKVEKNKKQNNQKNNDGTIAYRLKCAKTSNGLSHFVMYGDAPKDQAPV